MNKIKTFDYDTFESIRDSVDEALKAVGKSLGVSLRLGKGKYAPLEGHFLLKVNVVGKNGEVKDQAAEDFKRYANSYGLSPDDLGKRIIVRGKGYKIIGALPNRHKYPILTITDRGRRIIHPVTSIKEALGRAAEVEEENEEEEYEEVE